MPASLYELCGDLFAPRSRLPDADGGVDRADRRRGRLPRLVFAARLGLGLERGDALDMREARFCEAPRLQGKLGARLGKRVAVRGRRIGRLDRFGVLGFPRLLLLADPRDQRVEITDPGLDIFGAALDRPFTDDLFEIVVQPGAIDRGAVLQEIGADSCLDRGVEPVLAADALTVIVVPGTAIR